MELRVQRPIRQRQHLHRQKSGIAAALSMILLCVCQGVCLGLLLYYRLNP